MGDPKADTIILIRRDFLVPRELILVSLLGIAL
jgi:hypothetical protein